jgi:hypothetical protein
LASASVRLPIREGQLRAQSSPGDCPDDRRFPFKSFMKHKLKVTASQVRKTVRKPIPRPCRAFSSRVRLASFSVISGIVQWQAPRAPKRNLSVTLEQGPHWLFPHWST